jgi:lysophospholipase L1-like esterase
MQATHGSAVSFRGRGRLVGLAGGLVLALTALFAAVGPAPASASQETYMALGDSISFGYSEEKFNNNAPTDSPSFFEEGLTNAFKKKLGKETTIVNYACPGETSNGLIGENETIGGQKSTESIEEVEGLPPENFPAGGYQGLGDWHPCFYHNVGGLPLHSSLGERSQLEEALAVLNEGKPNHPVKAITLNIGSNDELAAITQCKNEVTLEFTKEGKSKYGGTPTIAVLTCIKETAEKVTVPHILANLGDILGVLDSTSPGGGHYTGRIVLLGFYNPDAFILPGSDELQEATNAAVVANILPVFKNVRLANPFPVFNKGAGTNAGQEKAAIAKYTEMCNVNDPGGNKCEGDIHPSVKGYKELGKLITAAFNAE